uniref:hypothetical protein n=1 Tax=Myrothecium inundatum TaxID=110576 RepID=UPI001EDD9174|nr:hypothetical protein MFQ09_mgp18 [Myrothecium inundatum]UIX25777.1 hypothetical protein [Myrothecium inundatum]
MIQRNYWISTNWLVSCNTKNLSTSCLLLYPSSQESNNNTSLSPRENSPDIGTEDLYHKDINNCNVNELRKMEKELQGITEDFQAAGIQHDDANSRLISFDRLNTIRAQLIKEEQGDIIEAVSTQGASKDNPIVLDKVQLNTAETAIAIEDSPEPNNKRGREDSSDNIVEAENNNKKFKQDSSDITADTEPMDFIDFE